MEIGYARISTGEQTLNLQRDTLKAASAGTITAEILSGAKDDRPVWQDSNRPQVGSR